MTATMDDSGSQWEIEWLRDRVSVAHAREMEIDRRRVVIVEPTDSAVVLSSTQSIAVLDHGAVAEAGLSTVRRRSGGGAVVVVPGELVWLDVEIPRDDPLWTDDVRRSVAWLGQRCAEAMASLGATQVTVSTTMQDTKWSRLVCFSGVGPGELTLAGRKILGVSQRRNRDGARFQLSALSAWNPEATAAMFDLTLAERGELVEHLEGSAAVSPISGEPLREALVHAITKP